MEIVVSAFFGDNVKAWEIGREEFFEFGEEVAFRAVGARIIVNYEFIVLGILGRRFVGRPARNICGVLELCRRFKN